MKRLGRKLAAWGTGRGKRHGAAPIALCSKKVTYRRGRRGNDWAIGEFRRNESLHTHFSFLMGQGSGSEKGGGPEFWVCPLDMTLENDKKKDKAHDQAVLDGTNGEGQSSLKHPSYWEELLIASGQSLAPAFFDRGLVQNRARGTSVGEGRRLEGVGGECFNGLSGIERRTAKGARGA